VATILVVDDERPVREFLAEILQEAGRQVLQAAHGREALAVLQVEQPELIIADIMMPILGGVELCRRVKADPGASAIPVILMSSTVKPPADLGGAEAFVHKPSGLGGIDKLVRRWLEPSTDAENPTSRLR